MLDEALGIPVDRLSVSGHVFVQDHVLEQGMCLLGQLLKDDRGRVQGPEPGVQQAHLGKVGIPFYGGINPRFLGVPIRVPLGLQLIQLLPEGLFLGRA